MAQVRIFIKCTDSLCSTCNQLTQFLHLHLDLGIFSRMPILDNQRHELFAQNVASGMSLTKAYQEAGYKKNDQAASKLHRKDQIKARIQELKEQAVSKFLEAEAITRDVVMEHLQELAEEAAESGQYGPAITAWTKIGIDIGMFESKSQVTVNHVEDKADTLAAARARAKSKMNGHYKH